MRISVEIPRSFLATDQIDVESDCFFNARRVLSLKRRKSRHGVLTRGGRSHKFGTNVPLFFQQASGRTIPPLQSEMRQIGVLLSTPASYIVTQTFALTSLPVPALL
eukprot:GHVU01021462.1.p1 GENE.GHVU01021462.1~~GHVU01021462.1.p1  ORF type:complete len:106 (+),score=0.21 GHVU01021462.1:1142-1459(+)